MVRSVPKRICAARGETALGASFVFNSDSFRESGYFDVSSITKPLLHLWSLGVEEQFYIVWPMLLFCYGELAASFGSSWSCPYRLFHRLQHHYQRVSGYRVYLLFGINVRPVMKGNFLRYLPLCSSYSVIWFDRFVEGVTLSKTSANCCSSRSIEKFLAQNP